MYGRRPAQAVKKFGRSWQHNWMGHMEALMLADPWGEVEIIHVPVYEPKKTSYGYNVQKKLFILVGKELYRALTNMKFVGTRNWN